MSHRRSGVVVVALVFLLAGQSFAQTNAATAVAPTSTNAPAATAPPPIALADVATQAQSLTAKLQSDQAALASDSTAQVIGDSLPILTRQVDDRRTEDAQLVGANPALQSIESSQAAWQALSDTLSASAKSLSARAKRIDAQLEELAQDRTQWQATIDSARKAKAPPEIIQAANGVLAAIDGTTKAGQAAQGQIFAMQSKVAAQSARIQTGLDAIGKSLATARSEILKQDHPPLWNFQAGAGPGIVAQETVSLRAQAVALDEYLKDKIVAILLHVFLFGLLAAGFYWLRRALSLHAKEEAALHQAAKVFDVPLATALLIALLGSSLLYPSAPRSFWAAIGAVALVPAVIILRRLIEPGFYPILYATVAAYFFDQLRYILMPAGILSRFLFLIELMGVGVFLVAILRSKQAAANHTRSRRMLRFYVHATFFVIVLAGAANILGYVRLSILAGHGMLESTYLAIIIYAAVRIADALLIAALNVRPFTRLAMVRHHQDLLYTHLSTVLRWVAVALWVYAALQIFPLRDPVWKFGDSLLTKQHVWGSMSFSLGPILAFPITVWASFLLSRFIRFALAEEVYPHLQLGRGVPYAASTMVHYAVLVLGFFAALDALGVDMTKFTVLAGAFGVGLGFGLQNIMNNFVSGIILLFERPVKVGDIVQLDATNVGTVERIGIRASVLRLTNGSEYIVPNGNLISNPVTNWTLSNCERLIEIPVAVGPTVSVEKVIDLLTRTVKSHPKVLANPPPQTLLVTFAAAAMSFRVRSWIDSEDDWMVVTSELSIAITAALAKENIAMT